VIDRSPKTPGNPRLSALIVTVAGIGTTPGAVYKPIALIVPTVESPPVTSFTFHLTPELPHPDTLGVNCSVVPINTAGGVGGNEMLQGLNL
jgi:hypothetical protein